MTEATLSQRLGSEFVGTAFLLATVVGSGIMGESLAEGNVAIALLANSLATGAILYVLITLFGPVSGAHFNPAVTFVVALRRELTANEAGLYIALQIAGGIIGVWAAHAMFGEAIVQFSQKVRTGHAQYFAEVVATFGLVVTILGTVAVKRDAVAMAVGLYITAAYWFTASTSFANPAVTVARTLSDTFAGIRPADMPAFIAAQLAGAVAAWLIAAWLFGKSRAVASQGVETSR